MLNEKASPAPDLLPVVAEKIPATLKTLPHWCVWRAEWNAERGKFDKIPCHPSGYGLSTRRPEAWVSFDSALRAYQATPGRFAGVGLLMSQESGVVGIDLDHCVSGNTVAPWALEVLDKAQSYAELSPSSTGLRVAVLGEVPRDWTDHAVGVEVYAGHTPRFLTITGQRLRRARETVEDAADFLGWLTEKYPPREPSTAPCAAVETPDLVDALLLPDLASLALPDGARAFLMEGKDGGDGSGALHAASIALYRAGLGDAEVLSLLANNSHAMEVALRHRRQDPDRALAYLWAEHGPKAKAKATPRVATADDFEDVSGQEGAPKVHPWAQFVDIASPPQAPRFILPGFIQEGVVVISGEPGIGKTTALVPLAMIAAGMHREGDPLAPVHWRHVCYVTEDEEQVHRIVHALAEFADWHVELAQVAERLHVAPARRLAPSAAVRVGEVFRAQFTRTVDGVQIPPLVVVDTTAAALALENENDNAEVSAAIAAFKQQFAGLPTWLVGHTAKNNWGQTDASRLSSRGGGAWGADAHQQLFLVEEDGRRFLQRGKTRFEAEWPALEIQGSTALLSTVDAFGKPCTTCARWGVPVPVATPQDGTEQGITDARANRSVVQAISILQGKGEDLPAVERGSSTAASVLRAHGIFKSRSSAEVHAMLRGADRSGLLKQETVKVKYGKTRTFWRLTEEGKALAEEAPN